MWKLNCSCGETLRSICKTHQVPYVQFDWGLWSRLHETLLQSEESSIVHIAVHTEVRYDLNALVALILKVFVETYITTRIVCNCGVLLLRRPLAPKPATTACVCYRLWSLCYFRWYADDIRARPCIGWGLWRPCWLIHQFQGFLILLMYLLHVVTFNHVHIWQMSQAKNNSISWTFTTIYILTQTILYAFVCVCMRLYAADSREIMRILSAIVYWHVLITLNLLVHLKWVTKMS